MFFIVVRCLALTQEWWVALTDHSSWEVEEGLLRVSGQPGLLNDLLVFSRQVVRIYLYMFLILTPDQISGFQTRSCTLLVVRLIH